MGYHIELRESSFIIEKDNFDAALAAVKAIPAGHYSWVADSFREAETLKASLDEWRYEAYFDKPSGDIVDLFFTGEKSGDEEVLFKALAPYVKAGSYLLFYGEDGAIWRWFFTGKRVIEQYADVTFPDVPLEDDRQLDLFPRVAD